MDDPFEFEYCHECGGDTEHHGVSHALFGLPFYGCLFPPNEDTGEQHPTITEFREHA